MSISPLCVHSFMGYNSMSKIVSWRYFKATVNCNFNLELELCPSRPFLSSTATNARPLPQSVPAKRSASDETEDENDDDDEEQGDFQYAEDECRPIGAPIFVTATTVAATITTAVIITPILIIERTTATAMMTTNIVTISATRVAAAPASQLTVALGAAPLCRRW